MSTARRHRPLLRDLAPVFADELTGALQAEGEAALASQVADLRVLSFCGCGDPDCASFTTRGVTERDPAQQADTIPLDQLPGMVHVDVQDGRIVYVEVMYRPELKTLLRSGFSNGRL